MCTLTFTGPGLVLAGANQGAPLDAERDRYQVWFNRDELRRRGAEIPPAEARTPSGVRYLAPTDSDAGGTWIAVNEFGITVALLNGYVVSKGPDRSKYTSRGALVRSLADLQGISDIWARLTPASLAEFRPAVLCLLCPGERPMVARWDGRDLEFDVRGDRQLPLTSSSYEQDEVQRYRRELYRKTVSKAAGGGPALAEDLMAFHAFVGPDGPTPMTPSMAREDAATRSHCAIDVRPGVIQLTYVPGPPHITAPGPTVSLRCPHLLAPSAPGGRARLLASGTR